MSNLLKLRESENISQVTFKDLGFSLTSSSQTKPAVPTVLRQEGLLWEKALEILSTAKQLKLSERTRGSSRNLRQQVAIRSPSIHHPSL